jgi:hypothetical protein
LSELRDMLDANREILNPASWYMILVLIYTLMISLLRNMLVNLEEIRYSEMSVLHTTWVN